MALHARNRIRDAIDDPLFAALDQRAEIPRYRFPRTELRPDLAYQLIADEFLLDGNARQNRATFCQTWEEPQVHRLMDLAIDKNLIDEDEYPQSAEIERRCAHMMTDLWHAPAAGDPIGTS